MVCADFFLSHATAELQMNLQPERIREAQRAHLGVLNDLDTGDFRSARQAGQHLAGVNRPSGDDADNFQFAGIVPGDG